MDTQADNAPRLASLADRRVLTIRTPVTVVADC